MYLGMSQGAPQMWSLHIWLEPNVICNIHPLILCDTLFEDYCPLILSLPGQHSFKKTITMGPFNHCNEEVKETVSLQYINKQLKNLVIRPHNNKVHQIMTPYKIKY